MAFNSGWGVGRCGGLAMVANFDVMKEISRFLRQEINAKSFRHWMVSAILDEERDGADEMASRLLVEIDGLYAQFSDNYLAEESLRKELAKLLLSNSSQGQFVHVEYAFVRPSFVNPLPLLKIKSNETASTEALIDVPQVTQDPVAA
jgi:hypothetical protein